MTGVPSATPRRDVGEVTSGVAPRFDRRFEAIVFDWDGTAGLDGASAVDPLRALVEQLCERGVHVAAISDAPVDDVDGRFRARPTGPGRLYLVCNRGTEVFTVAGDGPQPAWGRDPVAGADRGQAFADDPWHWLVHRLWSDGVPPDAVLVVGDEVGSRGEPGALQALLGDQLRRRDRGELPGIDAVPGWSLSFTGFDPESERVREAVCCLADGRFGTRGAPLFPHPAASPSVLAAGVYDGDGPRTALLPGPIWHHVVEPGMGTDGYQRILDLRGGILHEVLPGRGLRSVRFASLAAPGTVVVRTNEAPASASPVDPVDPVDVLEAPSSGFHDRGTQGQHHWMRVRSSYGGGICATACERVVRSPELAVRERIGVLAADPLVLPEPAPVLDRLDECVEREGFDRLLAAHRQRWAQRWEDADVGIGGDGALQTAVRFALFHLMASVASSGEAAVGARGLTGPAYRGHVFWDSDVFVLPFLAATHPPSARAMLEYRVRRMAAALADAAEQGYAGARFPWESAHDGHDVTPASAPTYTGEVVPVRTGPLEIHIVADVAWAASCYVDWTGDEDFAAGPGLQLLVETARFWVSRARVDEHGAAHLYGVVGPDEYHEPVDDNAFTNVMARWNLRRAAEWAARLPSGVSAEEIERWEDLAAALVDGYDPDTRRYEQFAGFYGLEPLVAAEIFPRRPIAADLVLGRDRTRGSQVIKQADVLLLYHLVPEEMAPGSLAANLAYYEPRTAHGSSLSPAVHADLLGRVGDWERALATLRLAGEIDLHDLTGTTAGGVHLATMGGLWQAIAYGFAGLRPSAAALRVDPRLPPLWESLDVRVVFRGTRVRVHVEQDRAHVDADGPLRVLPGGASDAVEVSSGRLTLRRGDDGRGDGWMVDAACAR